MSFQIRMYFYVQRTDDGLYHVQNVVLAHYGQHHVHDKAGYRKWLDGLASDETDCVELRKGGTCDCGLKAHQVRNHEGHVTENDRF